MARNLVGLDLGSSRIRAVVGALDDAGEFQVAGVGIAPSNGIRKGTIVEVEETIRALTAAVEDAERMAGEPIRDSFVIVGGSQLTASPSQGVIAVGSQGAREISTADVARVLDAAQSVSLPQNQQAIRTVPRLFAVDDQTKVKDPTGMTGIRLDADALVFSMPGAAIRNLEKCVHETGVGILNLVPGPLAAAEAVLDRRQKELGVCVLDLGAGSISLAVFEEGGLLHAATIGIGSENITNDLAIGLRSSIDTAEKVKLARGTCLADSLKNKHEKVSLTEFSSVDEHAVTALEIANIIEARAREIFSLAKKELRAIGRDGLLPAGVILTGATAKMPGILELARETLGLPAAIGIPRAKGVVEQIQHPAFATAIGAALFGARNPAGGRSSGAGFSIGGVFSGFGDWLKGLLPS